MKIIIIFFFFGLAFLLGGCSSNQSPVYYISSSGDNLNDGTSESKAWKSIDKINQTTFSTGSTILFKGGEIYVGKGLSGLTNVNIRYCNSFDNLQFGISVSGRGHQNKGKYAHHDFKATHCKVYSNSGDPTKHLFA